MNNDQKTRLQVLAANIQVVDNSISNLEELGALSYLYTTISQNAFAGPGFSEVENRADYLRGVIDALTLLGELPEAIRQSIQPTNFADLTIR